MRFSGDLADFQLDKTQTWLIPCSVYKIEKWTVSFKRQFYMDVLGFLLIKYFKHNIIALKITSNLLNIIFEVS